MLKKLADYAKDGGYEDSDGCWHEDVESFLQSGILGFCGCGMPEDNLLYVLRGLELIDEKRPDVGGNAWYVGHRARLTEHFKTSGAEYFFFYWCDKQGFTEHGGSVPGWLTPDGDTLLALLREWQASLPAEPGEPQ